MWYSLGFSPDSFSSQLLFILYLYMWIDSSPLGRLPAGLLDEKLVVILQDLGRSSILAVIMQFCNYCFLSAHPLFCEILKSLCQVQAQMCVELN